MGILLVITAISVPAWAYVATSTAANLDVSTNYTAGSSRSISVTIANQANWNLAPTTAINASSITSPNWSGISAPLMTSLTVNITSEPGDYFTIYMDHSQEPSFNAGTFKSTFDAKVNIANPKVTTDDINGVIFNGGIFTNTRINGLLNFAAMEKMLASNVTGNLLGAAIIPIRYYSKWATSGAPSMLTATPGEDPNWKGLASNINTSFADPYLVDKPFVSTTNIVYLRASLAWPKANGIYLGTLKFALITQ